MTSRKWNVVSKATLSVEQRVTVFRVDIVNCHYFNGINSSFTLQFEVVTLVITKKAGPLFIVDDGTRYFVYQNRDLELGGNMNIFELAMSQERKAESAYKELAQMTQSMGMKKILMRLADAEKQHRKSIQKLKKAETVDFLSSDILHYARDMITELKLEADNFTLAKAQTEFYKAAQVQEAESEEFYRHHAEKVSEKQGKILLVLADEEHQHWIVLGNIIEYLSFPAAHPEDAEFNAREET